MDGLISLAQSQSQLAGFQFGAGLLNHYIKDFETTRLEILDELRMLEGDDDE